MNITTVFMRRQREVKDKSSKRFDAWSKKYDRSLLQFLVFRKSHDMFLRNIIKDGRRFRVLDIGCGTGDFVMKLKNHRKDVDVSGIDISPEMIKIAKNKTKFISDIDFKIGDVEHMPYEDCSFDYITCAHSFHHYPRKKKAVREMFRVLKNKGKLLIIDGCKDGLTGKFIFDFIIKTHERDVHHLHSGQYQRILKDTGFKNINQEIFNLIIPLLFTKAVAYKESAC